MIFIWRIGFKITGYSPDYSAVCDSKCRYWEKKWWRLFWREYPKL